MAIVTVLPLVAARAYLPIRIPALRLLVANSAFTASGAAKVFPGVSARVVHYPDAATTIVALCNQDRGSWAASLRIGAALGVNEPHEMPA